MWELFKARTGAAAPLLQKIKLPGKHAWCHRLFPNAGKSGTLCISVSEFHQIFCTSTIWRQFPSADLWNSPWSSWESDTFTSSAKPQKNDWPALTVLTAWGQQTQICAAPILRLPLKIFLFFYLYSPPTPPPPQVVAMYPEYTPPTIQDMSYTKRTD